MASTAAAKGKLLEPDFVRQLVGDHRDVQAAFKQFDQAVSKGDQMGQEKLAHFVSVATVLHTHVEKELLYPMVEKDLSDGKTLARKALDEHQAMENDLAALETMKPGTEEFKKLFSKIRKESEEHFADEESNLLPTILEKVGPEEGKELSKKAVHIKQTASIHPKKT